MSIWVWMGQAVEGGVGALGSLFEWAGARIGDPMTRKQVAFSTALIALSAKMARVDGIVTAEEVRAFERMFVVPPGEERNVARLFDLAQRDVAGFETYAARIAAFYGDDRQSLEDVIDGLFAIARADSAVHEAEYVYLQRVAEIFGIADGEFTRIAARHVLTEEGDPYAILGIARSLDFAAIRVRYRALAAENHPDRLIGRGLPPEAAAIAHERMAAINRAFALIQAERGVR